MIVLMAQIFLALVIVAALMAVFDACRKILDNYRVNRRIDDGGSPRGPASA